MAKPNLQVLVDGFGRVIDILKPFDQESRDRVLRSAQEYVRDLPDGEDIGQETANGQEEDESKAQTIAPGPAAGQDRQDH